MQNLNKITKKITEVTDSVILSLLTKDGSYAEELVFNDKFNEFLSELIIPDYSYATVKFGSNVYILSSQFNWEDVDMTRVKETIKASGKRTVMVINQKDSGLKTIQEHLPYAIILKVPKEIMQIEEQPIMEAEVVEAETIVLDTKMVTDAVELPKEPVVETEVKQLEIVAMPRFYAAGSCVSGTPPKLGSAIVYPDNTIWSNKCDRPELVAAWAYGANVFAAALAVSGANTKGLAKIEVAVSDKTVLDMATGKAKVTSAASTWFLSILDKFKHIQITWTLVPAEENLASPLAKKVVNPEA